ncbi:leukocyte surface antigen CD53-like [Leptidea sinapis]|uniref:leukocyte surface antigen CD53-like n=1 Tax=Leptidea sinapis TaxID=189913 RepID=UPI00212A2308|nr:leukocyte surface antigen CD53-like [Leptidea sinapis]
MKVGLNFDRVRVPKLLKSVRYTLGGINMVFLLKSLVFHVIGITYLIMHKDYEELITNKFMSLPALVIGTAISIFFICILGFYGAYSENFYALAAYVVLMLAVFILEITITIMAFGLQNGAVSEIRPTMVQSIQLYETRREVARTWDDLQMGFECCGVAGRSDWPSNRIPVSCCHIDYGTVSPFECTFINAYVTGCSVALGEWLSSNAFTIGVTGAVFTSVQAILTAMSAWLAYRSKFEEVELES